MKSAYVMSVCMDNTGQFVAAGGLDNACTIYQTTTGQLKAELVSHEGYLADCKFFHSPDKILTSSADATSLLWDIPKGRIIDSFSEHSSNVTGCVLNGPQTFLTASTDATIKLWDVRTSAKGGSIQTLHGHKGDVSGIAVLPQTNGKSLVSCSEDGTVRVWDLRAYAEVSQFGQQVQDVDRDPFSDGDAGFTSITASKSGRIVFCGHSEGSIVGYDVLGNNKDPAIILNNAHDEHVSCVKVSPSGEALCSGSWDFNLKIFA
jgi:guanine nucleotide-binding protein G(I)/G(S)/G(T) subunit beta-1